MTQSTPTHTATLGNLFRNEDLDLRASLLESPQVLILRSGITGSQVLAVGQALKTELSARSALLLRDTGITTAQQVSALADAVFTADCTYRTGEHPEIPDTRDVYRPVPFSQRETLRWHHEDSHCVQWPRWLMFACLSPATTGGQTTLVDSAAVYNQMPREFRELLQNTGIDYLRRCDGRAGRTWQELYATTDRQHAEELATSRADTLTFLPDDTALISSHRPAFLATGGTTVWFNQILHWHHAALPADLRQMIRDGLIPDYRNCRQGDGSAIPDELVSELVEVHRRNELLIQWQPGDILLVDNLRFAHGRRPYTGPREHLVRMAGSGSYSQDRAS